MNKICKSYIADIKTLLPIKRKEERAFIKSITTDIENYFEDADVKSKQELYEGYGDPQEVATNYITSLDTKVIIKRIKISQIIRRSLAVFLIIAALAAVTYGLHIHRANKILDDLEDVHVEEAITIYAIPKNDTTASTNPSSEVTTP